MNNHDLRDDEEFDTLFDSARKSYKNIRAPGHLRARVLAPREKRNLFSLSAMRPIAALASVVLVVGFVLLALPKTAAPSDPLASPVATHTVSYQSGLSRMASQPEEDTAASMQVAEGCVALDMDFGCDVFIVVNRGKLLLPDEDGNLHFAGQSGPLTGGQTAYWAVDPSTAQAAPVAQFMDFHENILATVTLSYQTEEGIWYASTENKK